MRSTRPGSGSSASAEPIQPEPPPVAVTAIDREPRLVAVERPGLSARSAAAVRNAATRIAVHPHLVDGPVLMAAAADGDAITAFAATYAWHVASREGGVPEAGLGSVGVQVAVVDPLRGLLWQRRSDRVDHPGAWSIGAAGIAVPGRGGLREQALAELEEELGVDVSDIDGFEPMAVVVSRPQRVLQVVFRARLRAGVRPHPAAGEVDALKWAAAPDRLDGPLDALTGGWWRELVALAIRS